MPKYINTDKLLEKLPNDLPYKASVKRVLIQAPAEDVVEVIHGEWLEHEEMFYDGEFHSEYPMKVYKCSLCGRVLWSKEPYCNCGAKMDGGNAE